VGACAVAAILVKQNIADVAVFAVVASLVAYRRRQLCARDLARAALAASVGGAAAFAVVAAWTVVHGTSLIGVYDAIYPFRVRAARVIASSTSQAAEGRFTLLAQAWALSAVPLLVLAFAWMMVRHRLRGPVVWGLTAAIAFSVASILMGGSYWLHYLVEMIPAVAIVAGILAGALPRPGRLLMSLVATAGAVAWATALVAVPPSGTSIGTAIRSSAHAADTIVSAFGDADLVESSRLTSPYPYLWSLPSRTLDPGMNTLRATVTGPTPPTWFVVRGPGTFERLRVAHVQPVLDRDYRPWGKECGRTIYLRRGVTRPPVRLAHGCPSASSALATTRNDLSRAIEDVW
jgi:hypothetical protein